MELKIYSNIIKFFFLNITLTFFFRHYTYLFFLLKFALFFFLNYCVTVLWFIQFFCFLQKRIHKFIHFFFHPMKLILHKLVFFFKIHFIHFCYFCYFCKRQVFHLWKCRYEFLYTLITINHQSFLLSKVDRILSILVQNW